jgi:hypothetical protein
MTTTGGDDSAQDGPGRDAAVGRVRRIVVFTAGLVAIAALAFLAGSGGGLGPLDGLVGGDGSSVDADWSQAMVVASDANAGVVAAVEVAPAIDGDGACARVRLGEELVDERCAAGELVPWDDPDFEVVRLADYFGFVGEHAVRSDGAWVVALDGAVHPDVARVTAHFGDGGQYSFVTRNPGGWFVVVLPPDVADPDVTDGHLVNRLVRLELFDEEGTRLASVDQF